jgi:hypothetical protein
MEREREREREQSASAVMHCCYLFVIDLAMSREQAWARILIPQRRGQ